MDQRNWRAQRAATGNRFLFGVIVAGSLSLVAFEWRTPSTVFRVPQALGPEDDLPTEILPVIILEKPKVYTAPKPRKKSTTVMAGEPEPEPSPEPAPAPDPGTDPAPGPDPEPTVDIHALLPPERVETMLTWGTVGVRPYFMECLKRDPRSLEPCTEDRIESHLRNNFKFPRSLSGELRTTVTFEIDATGRIGKVVCAPKVDAEVLQEVERVVRSMPTFVPGSQGGIPVPVYYQIPLYLRTR